MPQRSSPVLSHAERAARGEESHYAVVDIGSNSVRLVVYDRLSRAPFPRFNEKSLCRLGDGLARSGEVSQESFERTLAAMRRFRAVADAMGVRRIDAIATEAVRRASNGGALVSAIARESGFAVRVLGGSEEAHYASLGVIAGIYRAAGVVGDMGGGSLEIAEIGAERVGEWSASMPLGALPVQAMLAEPDGNARRQVDTLLKEQLPTGMGAAVFYAVGGGWRSFARAHMASTSAPVRVAHGYRVDASEARAFARSIWRTPETKLAALAGVTTRRVPTLRASCLVLDRVLKRLASQRVVFSALGLREGWLYAQLPADERRLDPLLVGAQSLGAPQARVPEFAAALVRWTDELFLDETHDDARLRAAACALSDIAWRDHADVRAQETFRRLVQFPFIGLDHAERVFLGAAMHARYAGKVDDLELEPALRLLDSPARRRALILGRILLLGYRISGSVPEILSNSRLRIGTDSVRLEVGYGARVPDSEVVGNRLDLLAAAVGARGTEIVEIPSIEDRD